MSLRRRVAVLLAVTGMAAAASVRVDAQAAPGPPSAPEYWFDTWHVPQLWAAGARGQGVTIAEIDTGVNAAVPELRGRVLAGRDYGASGGDGRTDRSVSRFGHGTAMASIMVARAGLLGITGLAPAARILPISIPLGGTTDSASGDHLADAIRWAADSGAKIISMSLGSVARADGAAAACPVDEQDAIFDALRAGAVLFAAGGNRGAQDRAPEEPGACVGVVSVGAVNRTGAVASFSSRHPYLTMTAPGVNIPSLSRIPGSAFASDGTSQATALTAAAAAVVWSKYPSLDGRQVVARLLATLDRHRTTIDPAYGYGTLNLRAAVTRLVATDAPNPVFAAAAPFLHPDGSSASAAPPSSSPGSVAPSPTGARSARSSPGGHVPIIVVGVIVLLALVILAVVRRRRRPPPPPAEDWSGFAPPPPSSG